jgi:hypothetical protein
MRTILAVVALAVSLACNGCGEPSSNAGPTNLDAYCATACDGAAGTANSSIEAKDGQPCGVVCWCAVSGLSRPQPTPVYFRSCG